MRPVLFDQLLVPADFRLSRVRSPIGRGGVVEADVDIGVVLYFVEFVADVVGEEDEIQMSFALGCSVEFLVKYLEVTRWYELTGRRVHGA